MKKTKKSSGPELLAEYLVGVIGGFAFGVLGLIIAANVEKSIIVSYDYLALEDFSLHGTLGVVIGEAIGASLFVIGLCKLIEVKGKPTKTFLGAFVMGLLSIVLIRLVGTSLLFTLIVLPSLGAVLGYNFAGRDPYVDRAD